MMLFLLEARIRAASDKLNGQAMSTNGLMRHVYSSFGRSNPEVKSYLPFNKLQSIVTDPSIARAPLSIDHHRLLFKDFVEFKPGLEVTLLESFLQRSQK